ncbi:conjugal transfer protein TrbA [Burkholderia sp. Tr-862]|uniref:secretion/conjugation apparatus DotM-related subunit n=1 Tax=Burkholderia sp. Tr-862 TaxID=2608331 RepID=UPI00141A2977|nr:conjugal transfer protein TrbA [Burkholderia sp. Tr-862]NIF40187.1 conjugal transfer protein TrbA [Burkholderia sp. Tr-862]
MPDQVSNRSSAPLIILSFIIIGVAMVLMWHLKHEVITQKLLIWKAYEVLPISYLSDTADELKGRLVLYFRYARVMTFKEVFILGWQIGAFYVVIPIGLSVWIAWKASRHPIVLATRVHTVQSLLEVQSKSFSAVAPILKRDLIDDPSPEWASSMHPEEWVAENGLIVNERLEVERTRDLLVGQLGKPVKSLSKLKAHEKALFAIFGLRVFFKDTKASQALIDALNYSAINVRSRPDFSLAREAFERCASAKPAKKWLMKHPYPRTLLMALLIESRQMGVLPSSNFIWLKPLDRALWYPLNTAGRKVPFMESAGVFNQMQAEEVAWDNNCVLTDPHVDDAVRGIQQYLEETGILDAPTKNEFTLRNPNETQP